MLPVRRGFTLVELLVVISIIAVLIAVLLPAIARAQVQARRVACMSNVRQLGVLMNMYVGLGRGYFPRPGCSTQDPFDYLYWHANRDPRQGMFALLARGFDKDLYLCPADDGFRPRIPSPRAVKFSYTLNEKMCRDPKVVGGMIPPTLKVAQVRRPAEKIVVICENGESIDDGIWANQQSNGAGRNSLSARHDRRAERTGDPTFGRGVAGFCDGHVEFIERRLSFDPRHWDPAR
jgi:prepilin-type N-terminal cleavage/methylation domain-containing protein